MAINYKEIKEKLERAPLTPEEINLINEAEEYIDGEIVKNFGGSTYGEIFVELQIPNFSYSPKQKKALNLKHTRATLMQKELEARYKKAGWKITISYDDGLDGPNMSGPDYWILKGGK